MLFPGRIIPGRRPSRGNLFLVRVDARGHASVRQAARTVNDTDFMRVARIYQALFPADAILADLLRYPPAPCPKRANPAPRGGAA